METWADGANRADKADEDWHVLRADVDNPNLRDFEKLLETEVGSLFIYLYAYSHTHIYACV